MLVFPHTWHGCPRMAVARSAPSSGQSACNGISVVLLVLIVTGLLSVLHIAAAALPARVTDGTAPAKGWNSWNNFRCNINEGLVKQVADAMVTSGLRDAGYVYVNIDDCWMERRDEHGVLQPFSSKFPSGMKVLADYVHSRGLKLGLYGDAGNKTCEGYPGSWGHEVQDARTFAEWGIDYLKYDYCGMPQEREAVETAYHTMSVALAKSGRHILFSMCSWGAGQPWQWAQGIANSWRVSPDLFAAWDRERAQALHLPSFLISVMEVVEIMAPLHKGAQPGSFNDGDMLVVGLDGMYPYGIPDSCPPHIPSCKPGQYISREEWGSVGGLTLTQQRSHFSLWVMLSSPLILGNDPRFLRKPVQDMLTAPEVLEIHSDPLGKQAERIHNHGPLQLWRKDLKGAGKVALLVLNAKGASIDSTDVSFVQHFKDLHSKWARDVPEALKQQSTGPACEDEAEGCAEWAAEGECEKNPGFMLMKCRKSCPGACSSQSKQLAGAQSSAVVRDVWAEEDLGLSVGRLQVKHLEPYEGRLFVLQFVDPMGLGAGAGGMELLAGGGVAGTAGYAKTTSSARELIANLANGTDSGWRDKSSSLTSIGSNEETATVGTGTDYSAKCRQYEGQVVQLSGQVQQLTQTLAQAQQQLKLANEVVVAKAAAVAVAKKQLDIVASRWVHSGDAASSTESRNNSNGAGAMLDKHWRPSPTGGFRHGDGLITSLYGQVAVCICALCLGIALGVGYRRRRRGMKQSLGYAGYQRQYEGELLASKTY